MATISDTEVINLATVGLKGNKAALTLLYRRLASKLKLTNPQLADQLELLTESQGAALRARPLEAPPPVDMDSRRSLLQESFPVMLEVEPVWSDAHSTKFERLFLERNNAEKLIDAGLSPLRSMLFYGPPGVGKTLAAKWIARELNLPLLSLDLATVMSSFLGKTGTNIRAVIDYARGFPCVLLLDEFDAIAKRRDDERDVGELKRLVNVLLQAMDDWPSTSLLIAATNHSELLDPAVWRRFDLLIDFDRPDQRAISAYLVNEGLDLDLSSRLSGALTGRSYANLHNIVVSARKESILTDISFEHALIDKAASSVGKTDALEARKLNTLKYHLMGLSNRRIAEILGVSHTTVAQTIKNIMGDINGTESASGERPRTDEQKRDKAKRVEKASV